MTQTEKVPQPIVCPLCGGSNDHDAVFCGDPRCGKALGEFRYVQEELLAKKGWHERLAERVATFAGKPHFLAAHTLWFGIWVAINTGLVAAFGAFDAYPFGLLGIILSVEAIFITGFLLISSNRQAAYSDARAELDYEVNVKTYRHIKEIDALLKRIDQRLTDVERAVHQR